MNSAPGPRLQPDTLRSNPPSIKKPPSFLAKLLVTVGILAVVIGAIVFVKVMQIKTLIGMKWQQPPESVSTAVARQETWRQTLDSVGSLTAVQGVTVAAELDGKIVDIAFEAGREVAKGDLLVKQDTAVEEAMLRSAEAAVELAKVNLDRTKELLAKATVSKAQLDTDQAAYLQALASADNIRATIAKKTIRAPFAGRLGIRLVNLGQNLKAGDSIVSLQALNPIFVDFYLPQQELIQIKSGLVVRISGDALGGKPMEGKITAISPDVDASTRNVRVEGTIENKSELLHPGMYVDVAVELPGSDKVLVIPETAILYAPYGDTVYVVDEKEVEGQDGKKEKQLVVRQQIVRLGSHRGDFVAVTSGLKEGETVVSSGVFRLRPGGTVTVNNTLAPNAELTPKPSDS
jgi:membrane fusion protein (multidrug efflux system)